MGNPQPKVHEWEIGWLAGFIDADGSIHFSVQSRQKADGTAYYSPYIQIANTDVPTLARVTDLLERMGLPVHVHWKENKQGFQRKTGQKRKQWYTRAVGMKRCERWLSALLPYFTTRNEQAELMLEFIHSRLSHEGNAIKGDTRYSEREMAIITTVRNKNRGLGSETTRWLPDF